MRPGTPGLRPAGVPVGRSLHGLDDAAGFGEGVEGREGFDDRFVAGHEEHRLFATGEDGAGDQSAHEPDGGLDIAAFEAEPTGVIVGGGPEAGGGVDGFG